MARRKRKEEFKDVTFDVQAELENIEKKVEDFNTNETAYWRFKDPNKVYHFKGFKLVAEDLRNNQDLVSLFFEKGMEDELIEVKN